MSRVRIFFLIVVVILSASSQALCDNKQSFNFFDAKGVRIRYLLQGAGEPVVLIHGLGSSALLNWKLPGIIDLLSKKRQVIALDLPGHGGSDKPDKQEAYGVQMVEDVVLLLDYLSIKKAHIVGFSLGGMIALKLISQHPDRTLSGVLGGMGWLREAVWDKMSVPNGGSTPTACINSMGKLAMTEDALKAIKTPVIILIGDRDPLEKLFVAPLREERKDWPVIEIKDAGHLNCVVKKQFGEEIVKWVAKNSVSP